MDLDSFANDYRKFKARVLPMVEDWERAKVEPEMSDELKAQIFAPLSAEAVAAQSRPIAPAPEDTVLAGPTAAQKAADAEKTPTAGPTIQQWVAAGYKASNYPPSPYASSSSAEDVAAAVAAEKAAEAEKAPADPPLQSASEPAVHLET
jgi:hypothetical protein